MSLLGILLFIFIGIISYYLYTGREPENFTQGLSPPPTFDPIDVYQRQFKELNNVNNVLKRPTHAGDRHIEEIHPLRSSPDTNIATYSAREEMAPAFGATIRESEQECLSPDHPIYNIIKERQPHIFDKPNIIRKDGELFYYDWRYPRHPINVKFAADPVGFCQKNPGLYPCTVISSRTMYEKN